MYTPVIILFSKEQNSKMKLMSGPSLGGVAMEIIIFFFTSPLKRLHKDAIKPRDGSACASILIVYQSNWIVLFLLSAQHRKQNHTFFSRLLCAKFFFSHRFLIYAYTFLRGKSGSYTYYQPILYFSCFFSILFFVVVLFELPLRRERLTAVIYMPRMSNTRNINLE